jgi:hypothetical protein
MTPTHTHLCVCACVRVCVCVCVSARARVYHTHVHIHTCHKTCRRAPPLGNSGRACRWGATRCGLPACTTAARTHTPLVKHSSFYGIGRFRSLCRAFPRLSTHEHDTTNTPRFTMYIFVHFVLRFQAWVPHEHVPAHTPRFTTCIIFSFQPSRSAHEHVPAHSPRFTTYNIFSF